MRAGDDTLEIERVMPLGEWGTVPERPVQTRSTANAVTLRASLLNSTPIR